MKKNNKNTITHEYVIDDSKLFDQIDEMLVNLDISVLEKTRKELIKSGESTEIIDKAINEQKRRNNIKINNQRKEERKNKEMVKNTIWSGLLSGLFSSKASSNSNSSDLMSWEQDLVNKGKYEKYNFDEEELEEDDYYYEDDKQ